MIAMEYRIPADAKCIGRDRKRRLALITFADAGRWIRRWFADDPSLHHVPWYHDAMDRDSTETTIR